MMNQTQLHPLVMRHWRIIFILWIILTIITSAIGMNSLITSPIHPIYFVLITLLPSTVFLIISLITSHSFFSQLFIGLTHKLFKTDHANAPTQQFPIKYVIQLISNSTWLVILITSLIVLLFKFTFQHFDFYLGNTFTESKNITEQIIHLLNALPSKLQLVSFDEHLIAESFASQNLSDASRSMWAKWTISMIIVYGIVPRFLVLLYFAIRCALYSAPKQQLNTHINNVDKALSKPLILRGPKPQIHGSGHAQAALDITDQIRLSPNTIKLNDIEAFQQFEQRHKASPLNELDIFLDGNLMPDRGLLRRLIRLLNLSENATIYISTQDSYQKSMWEQHLSTLLVEGEQTIYDI